MIKQLRKQMHLSQEDFAEEIGISVRHLQRLEKDDEKTRVSTFKKIVKSLNVSDEEILKFIKK